MPLYQPICENAQKIGWNPNGEQFYFSSGVIYAKDTPATHHLFNFWHQYWQEGLEKGINIDQPSLAKANIECEHIIQRIDDKWNCIMFTYPRRAKDAYILHFAAYRNMSFLFSKRVLCYIKESGLTNYIKQYILHPTESYIPFDSEFYHYSIKEYIRSFCILYRGIKDYAQHIDTTIEDYKAKDIVGKLLRGKMYLLASVVLILLKGRYTKLTKKYMYKENICSK